MSNKVLLTRSSALSSGLPAVPNELDYGELAINYHTGKETLFIQNNNDEIVSFSSDDTIINYIDSKLELSLTYQMSSLLNDNLQLNPGDTYEEAFGKLEKALIDDELVFSSALNDLDNRISNIPEPVKPDWNATSGSDAEILNKPTIPQVLDYPSTGSETTAAPSVRWTANAIGEVDFRTHIDGTTIDINTDDEMYVKSLSADKLTNGTNNKVFTSAEQTKLSGIAAGAEVNVQSDWNQTNSSSDDYIKNKPTNVSSFTNDSGYYKDVEYDGTNLNINFKDGQTVLDSLNVTQMLLQHGVEYIESTQSASTASWTGITKSTSLNAGKTIVYRLLKAGTSSNATLNLTFPDGTTSGAKPVYYTADTRATTHYGANSIILLTYDGAGWRRADYNSNTTYSAMTDAQLKAGTSTSAYRISPKILADNMYIDGNTIGIRGETITIKEHELSSEYEPSSLTNEDLFLASGDTYDEAFGKLEKIINDNEIISSAGLVDLDDRVTLVENSKWSKSELGIMTTTEIQSIWDQVFNDDE